eukprot:9495985-Pyramimonas_sp.AAC.1
MLLHPYRRISKRFRGLGYEAPSVDQKWTRYYLKVFLHRVYRSGQTPVFWHLSQGVAINFKRLVHVLCPFGKAFIATGLRPDQRDREPLFAHGCVAGRRRETAMMIQQSLSW